jgi:hypothetical protein
MRTRTTFWGILIGFLLPTAALACHWDIDTLANEAKGLPDVIQVVTGRFERNPPLYYEIRLKRVATELSKDPSLLGNYDDAGVACDCLNRGDEAIAWMQRKRARLEQASKRAAEVKEQWYRYYANLGTFRAHRWLRAGADRKHIAEMKQARDEIAKAIEINPNAHFGREKVQLAFMEWLIAPGKSGSGPSDEILALVRKPWDPEQTRKGLCGLIVLGSAWESLDAFLMLTDHQIVKEPLVQYFAALRCKELMNMGRQSLHAERFTNSQLSGLINPQHLDIADGISVEIEEQYRQLRLEAEAWQVRRTDYMVTRLKAGRHPDTDPSFWKEWQETPPPSLEVSKSRFFATRLRTPHYIIAHFDVVALMGLVVCAVFVVATIGWRRRKALRAQRPRAA